MSIASVLLGTLATQFLGAVWYSVFSGLWLQGMGKKQEDFKDAHRTGLTQSAVSKFALSALMSITLRPFFGVVTVEKAVHFSLRVSAVVALLQVPHKAFEGKGWSTFLVNVGYDTLSLLAICVIIIIF